MRDSGSIEQDADVVLFLYRAAYYNSKTGKITRPTKTKRNALWLKTAMGETSVVRLGWDGAHTRFSNLDVTHEF